ncbi:MAG: hypothetical protein KKE20_06245 [Nanoarchaeota archaeon]|nr:hypothetical protein [Nanoarchaeota archaeon]
MDDIEDLKRKKLEQLQKQYQDQMSAQAQEQSQMNQQVEQLENAIKTRLTKEALQRYGNIKAADPEKATQVLLVLAQIIQSGRMSTIDDQQFKRILAMMSQGKKDIKIVRK